MSGPDRDSFLINSSVPFTISSTCKEWRKKLCDHLPRFLSSFWSFISNDCRLFQKCNFVMFFESTVNMIQYASQLKRNSHMLHSLYKLIRFSVTCYCKIYTCKQLREVLLFNIHYFRSFSFYFCMLEFKEFTLLSPWLIFSPVRMDHRELTTATLKVWFMLELFFRHLLFSKSLPLSTLPL